jgi:ribonuclease BN (tRNA processing enzyme)
VETYAVRAEAGGRVLVYTADTGPSEDVAAHAGGADLLIAEASFQDPVEGGEEIHMTATQAGELASKAGAGRLVLTHIPPGLDKQRSLEQARRAYGGETLLASDGLVLAV